MGNFQETSLSIKNSSEIDAHDTDRLKHIELWLHDIRTSCQGCEIHKFSISNSLMD